MGPVAALVVMVPLRVSRYSAMSCAAPGARVVSTHLVMSLLTTATPEGLRHCSSVAGSRVVILGAGTVSGLTTGGASSEYHVRNLTPRARLATGAAVSVRTVAVAFEAWVHCLERPDPFGIAPLAVGAGSSARVTTECLIHGRSLR